MMKSLVVDASFTTTLILPGPRRLTFRSAAAEWQKKNYTLYAPTLWLYEMTSAITKAVRFAALEPDEGLEALASIHRLGVQLIPPDETQTALAFEWTLRLNRASAYDSFYLALAESLQVELWTADLRLRNAVNLPWVQTPGEG